MFDQQALAQLLGKVTHFKTLSIRDRLAIIGAGRVRRYDTDETIFAEGAACAGMFVLLRGEVHLCKTGPNGQEHIMAVIEPVIMFNEVPVLDGGPNVATAVAHKPCIAWQINCDAFQQLLDRYPQIGLGLLRVMARRNRFLIAQYEDLSFRSVVGRTAKLLLDLSEQGAESIDRLLTTNMELAARVATSPEAFSRALRMLREQGYVETTRDAISVNDVNALLDIAQLDV